MSRNFTTDVDTQREYFNATYFNNSGQNQIAKYDTTLLKPFFNDPDKWKLAINRMRVPLSAIPLTKNNIPFNQWEVGLYYSNSGVTKTIKTFVDQYNPTVITSETAYIINNNESVQSVSSNLQSWNILNSYSLPQRNDYDIYPSYDNVGNGTLYLASENLTSFFCYDITTGDVIDNVAMPGGASITALCANPVTGTVFCNVGNGINTSIFPFTRSGNNWTVGNIVGGGIGQVQSMTIYNQDRIIAINPNNGDAWVVSTAGGAQPYINEGAFPYANLQTQFDPVNLYCYTMGNFGASVGMFSKYRINPQGEIVYFIQNLNLSFELERFLGFDPSGNILVSTTANTYIALNHTNGEYLYQFNPSETPIFIVQNPTVVTEPVDSGPYDIFTYQQFLNKINDAYVTAFDLIRSDLGAAFIPTEPPRVVFDANTKLFSMICEGQYLTLDASGNNIYQILINTTLWNKFLFSRKESSPLVGFESLLLQNNGINAFVGTGSATLPQYIYVQQEQSTIYAFYDLVRIIVGTTRIPVSGDGEGKTFQNTGFTSNSAINMITDIVPDTTTLTPGSVLIYVPAGILRWYNLYAQQPFEKVDLILYYETKDGSIYPIQVINGEFFSVKLEFKKGPGDF
jgi:hypothetical protein